MLFQIILLSTVVASVGSDLSVRGSVRDSETGEPVERVLVESLDEPRHAWSDSLGLYDLPLAAAGPHRVRFTRLGYDPLEIEVVMPGEGVLRLDASLSPRPIALSGVHVTGANSGPAAGGGISNEAREPGSRSFAIDDWGASGAFGGRDALGALAASPDVVVRGDAPTALHVRGGSAGENVVLIDGLPMYGAYHVDGALSAVNPDAVAGVTLHAGVAPARLGGALSSAIEIQTREAPRTGVEASGALTSRSTRVTAAHALPGGIGGILVSGRRSYRPEFWTNGEPAAATFGDLLIKGTGRVAGGALEVLSFQSRDRLGFDALADPQESAGSFPQAVGGAGAGSGAGGALGLAAAATEDLQNRFDWESGLLGLLWSKGTTEGTRGQLRAWRSAFDASADWAAEAALLRLSSDRNDLGVEGAIEGGFASGRANAGIRVERTRVRYRVRSSDPSALSATNAWLALESAPTIVTVFGEDAWRAADRLELHAGLRGRAGPGLAPGLEPRLSLAFAPAANVVLSAGYARTLQDVQSLRNEESVLDAVVGIDLPVAAQKGRVPTARADQLTAAATARLGGTQLFLEAYARWLDGLLLVAPATSQPFAVQGFETGGGRAAGAALVVERQGPRLSGRAAFALGTTSRRSNETAYHSGFERGRSVSLALEYRLTESTRLQTGLLAASGSPTTSVAGPFAWDASSSFGRNGEIEGSPQRILGALNGERLPSYVRWDVAVRREWSVPLARSGSVLGAYVGVANVLNLQNPIAFVVQPGTSVRRGLSTLPRSMAVGLEWRY